MKRLVLAAAVFVVAACKMEEKAADPMRIDTAAPAMGPAMTDSAMKMDSATHDAMMKDSAAKAKKGMKKTP